MKSRGEVRRPRFALLECYSQRFVASPPRFGANPQQMRVASATNSPTALSSLYLKPCEVLYSQFLADSSRPVQNQLFLKAYRYRAEGFFKSAVQTYEQLLQTAPEHLQAKINLGVCYLKLGQVNRASELYASSVASGCSDFRLLYNHAIIKVLEGDHDSARKALDEAVKTASGPLLQEIEKLREAAKPGSAKKPASPSRVTAKHETPRDVTLSFSKGGQSCGNLSFSRTGPMHSSSFRLTKVSEPPRLWRTFRTVTDYTTRPSTVSSPRLLQKTQSSVSLSKPSSKQGYRPRKRTVPGEDVPANVTSPNPQLSFKNQELVRVHFNAGLLEEDLEDESTLRRAVVDEALEFSVRTKALEVGAELRKEADKVDQAEELLPCADVDGVLGAKLGADALITVRAELRKDLDQRGFEVLLKAVGKLKFFVKFKREIQRKFLRIGLLRTAQHREELFRQGDQGDFMYVILHGSVSVSRQAVDFGHEPLVINTLYDGDSFGELGLYSVESHGQPEGRSATCIAAELTDLLLIPKAAYHSIMRNELESLLDVKLNFLAALPFFRGAPLMNLIPLASNLEAQVFTFSQPILRRGETPTGLYLLFSGCCSLYSDGFCLRPKKLAQYASARIRSPRPTPFRIGNTEFHSPKPKGWDPEIGQTPDPAISLAEIARDQKLKAELSSFFPGQDLEELLKGNYVSHERIFKQALQPRDYFGGRALLETASHDTAFYQRVNRPCKYSVVAESAKVEVLIISRFQLPLLGEKLMAEIRRYLDQVEDVDCPSSVSDAEIETEFRNWAQYKAKLIDQSRRSQYLMRSKDPGAVL